MSDSDHTAGFTFEVEAAPAGVVRSALVGRGLLLAGRRIESLRLGFMRLAVPGGVTLVQFRPLDNPVLGLQLDPARTGEDELGVHATTPLGPGLPGRLAQILPAEGAAVIVALLGAFLAEVAPLTVLGRRSAELRVLRALLGLSGPFTAAAGAVSLHEALYFTLRHGQARGVGA